MNDESLDVLMITHQRPDYVKLSLPRLLDGLDESSRLWLWHNGDDVETRKVVESYSSHPRVFQYHYSPENLGLRTPTNWMWKSAAGAFVSKIDDDCLIPDGWLEGHRTAHRNSPTVGVTGSWRFYDEDFRPDDALAKVQTLNNGIQLMRNHWVQGSGYLAKRSLIDLNGPLKDGESFPDWCIRAAKAGFINGWVFPFLHEEHMDDPRSPWTMYTSDEIFMKYRPLSAFQTGVVTLDGWTEQMKRSAYDLQRASLDIRDYGGLRLKWKNARTRLQRVPLLRQFLELRAP